MSWWSSQKGPRAAQFWLTGQRLLTARVCSRGAPHPFGFLGGVLNCLRADEESLLWCLGGSGAGASPPLLCLGGGASGLPPDSLFLLTPPYPGTREMPVTGSAGHLEGNPLLDLGPLSDPATRGLHAAVRGAGAAWLHPPTRTRATHAAWPALLGTGPLGHPQALVSHWPDGLRVSSKGPGRPESPHLRTTARK